MFSSINKVCVNLINYVFLRVRIDVIRYFTFPKDFNAVGLCWSWGACVDGAGGNRASLMHYIWFDT